MVVLAVVVAVAVATYRLGNKRPNIFCCYLLTENFSLNLFSIIRLVHIDTGR